jgi:hypothetical protein
LSRACKSLCGVAKKPLGPGCHELRRRQPAPAGGLALVVSNVPARTLFQHDGGPTCAAVEREPASFFLWGAPPLCHDGCSASTPQLGAAACCRAHHVGKDGSSGSSGSAQQMLPMQCCRPSGRVRASTSSRALTGQQLQPCRGPDVAAAGAVLTTRCRVGRPRWRNIQGSAGDGAGAGAGTGTGTGAGTTRVP